MKKIRMTALLSAAFIAGSSMTCMAAGWQNMNGVWKWQNEDGSYAVSSWQWLDGNQDGIAECYYFDGNGCLLTNTVTPDGYTVNADGAWITDGVVQTKQAAAQLSASMDGYYYPAMLTVTTTGVTESHDYGDYLGNIVFQVQADGTVATYYPNNEIDGQPTYILTKIGENTYQRSDELGRPMILTIVDSQTFTLTESDGLFLYTYKKR